jgi:hypothetical protein
VTDRNSDLRKAWREANDRVREAEARLGDSWTSYSSGKSSAPDKALMAEVSRLRRECNLRLAALLDQYSLTGPSKGPKERPGS